MADKTDANKEMKVLGQAALDTMASLKSKSFILGLESTTSEGLSESLIITGVLLAEEHRAEYANEMAARHSALLKKFKEAAKS